MSRVWTATLERNALLAWAGLLHLLLVPPELALLALDPRVLNGESVWFKPLRFDVSIAIFVLTMAWVISVFDEKRARGLAWRIAAAVSIETVCIAFQAARGVTSHFNQTTPFNGAVFTLMGLAIAYNTYVVARIAWWVATDARLKLDALWRRCIFLGLCATLLGSSIGGFMAARLGHHGVHGGDVRLAHFIGLHGLQLLLVTGLVLSRAPWPVAAKMRALHLTFLGHFALMSATLIGA
jgi:hypothetical protein